MKRYLKFFMPVVATVALLFASCSSSNDSDEQSGYADVLVPKNAYVVANANLNTLWDKGELANFESLKSYSLVSETINDLPEKYRDLALGLLRDPSTSGIDTKKDIFVFAAREDNDIMVAVTASLKSKKDFSDLLSTFFKIKSSNGIDLVSLDKDALLAFNDKNAVVVATSRDGRNNMEKYAKKLLSMNKNKSISSDSKFNEYWTNRKEIGVYVPFGNILNDEVITSTREYREATQQTTADQLDMLKNASAYYTLAFEDGCIDMQCKALGISSEYDVRGNGIASSLMKFMPDQTLAAASISLDMRAFVNNLEANKDVRNALDERVEGTDFTIKDIVNAFGGNIVANFYGMNYDKPLFAVAADLNSGSVVSTIRDILGNLDVVANNVYELPIPNFPLWLYFDGSTIALTDDVNAAQTYADGGFSNGLGLVADKARKGNYFYMDLNIHHYPDEILRMLDYRYDPMLEQALSLLDNAEAMANQDNSGTFRINLTTRGNSLLSIIQLADNLIYNEAINGSRRNQIAYEYDY